MACVALRAVCLLASLSSSLFAQVNLSNERPLSATTFWTIPKVAMLDVAQSVDGTVIILVQDNEKQRSMLIGPSESGPGLRVLIENSKLPAVFAVHVAVGAERSLWIGGTKDIRRSIGGAPLSNVYVAKIGADGRTICDVEIARNRESVIQDLAILPSGDIAIVGRQDEMTWLARISNDGRVMWEKTFGLGNIASLAVFDDTIAVMAFQAVDGQVNGSIGRVAVWRFTSTGDLVDSQFVRSDIGQRPSSAWLIKARSAKNALYAVSAWTEPFSRPPSAKALSVTKMNAAGQIIWQRDLPDTVVQSRIGPMPCPKMVTSLLDGGILTYCAAEEGITLFYLEPTSGEITRELLPSYAKPGCDGVPGSSPFIVQHGETSIWMFGTGRDCSWLQQITLRHMRH